MNPDYSELYKIQREFFQLLDEIFKKSTGKSYEKLCAIEEFDDTVRNILPQKIKQVFNGTQWGYIELQKYYSKYKNISFDLPTKIGGVKFLLGGSRLGETYFSAIRKMVLYSDTVLIPDPVLPWVETFREEEQFRDVHFLKAMFILLHLKPLIDADLPYPPIVVFPSWEKSLEQQDKITKQNIFTFSTNFFSCYLNRQFSSLEDVVRYVNEYDADFLSKVESENLFVAPGELATGDIKKSIAIYKEFMQTWRSTDYLKKLQGYSDSMLVFNCMMERLTPQYHLLENSEALQCQPLLHTDVNWHYYNLCSKIHEDKLLREKFLKLPTISTIRSLNDERFKWLGNIQIDDLVILRKDNCNEQFRKRLAEYMNELHESSISDLDRVANEVSRGISTLLLEHQNAIRKIQDEYNRKYKKTLTTAIFTAAALLSPILGPMTGVVDPLLLASKYFWDKIDEIGKKKAVSKSLMGILAKVSEE